MKKSTLLPKRLLTKFTKDNPGWLINDGQTEVRKDFPVKDYISGLMFISKIIVIAQVNNFKPIFTVTTTKVRVLLKSAEKTTLKTTELNFIEKINEIPLSPKKRIALY